MGFENNARIPSTKSIAVKYDFRKQRPGEDDEKYKKELALYIFDQGGDNKVTAIEVLTGKHDSKISQGEAIDAFNELKVAHMSRKATM